MYRPPIKSRQPGPEALGAEMALYWYMSKLSLYMLFPPDKIAFLWLLDS